MIRALTWTLLGLVTVFWVAILAEAVRRTYPSIGSHGEDLW